MTNMELAGSVIQELVQTGVREFVLCAGARNSPLVHILDEAKNLKVYSYFEERSGAFFALGRMAVTRRPVAIITTSGTAVAELLPAAVEATYSSLPLIMVTADRPKSYRGSGAPQTIEQVGIFSYYNEVALDIDAENSHISFKSLSWKKPIHVNVSFTEPLIDGPIPQITIPENVERTKLPAQIPLGTLKEMEEFMNTHKPLVLVGILPEKATGTVLEFLRQYKAPIYAEGISGLRGHPELRELQVRSGEKILQKVLKKGECDSILRIGGIPTVRLWRDLEDSFAQVPVFSVGFNHFTGLSRPVQHCASLDLLSQVEFNSPPRENFKLAIEDGARTEQLRALLLKYPKSEQGMIFALSKKIKGQALYLGNSLPIREWDACADDAYMPARVAGNRGANGIDGQLSTFFGWSHPDYENWCLVGDLTTMYDLSAPWVADQLETKKFRIVVINNQGGQIFSRMFKKDIFVNRHNVQFDSWAKMWRWDYQKWDQIPESSSLSLADRQVIELIPDDGQTQALIKELSQLWQD